MALEEGRYFTGLITDKRFQADGMAEYFKRMLSDGVWSLGSNLQVTSAGGMAVNIDYGSALIQGFPYKLKDNGTGQRQFVLNAGAAQPRIDRIVIRLDRTVPDQAIKLAVKEGVPAESPSPPALIQTDDIFEISLAQIYVGAGVVSINDANITDQRVLVNQKINNDGWISAGDEWTPVSATQFTVDGDQRGKYGLGDKLKWAQGGSTRYSNVVAAPAYNAGINKTTITIHNGYQSSPGDCSIFTDSPVINNFYSKIENPQGFPHRFFYNTLLRGSTTAGVFTYSAQTGFFSISDRRVFVDVMLYVSSVVTAAAGQVQVLAPITATVISSIFPVEIWNIDAYPDSVSAYGQISGNYINLATIVDNTWGFQVDAATIRQYSLVRLSGSYPL